MAFRHSTTSTKTYTSKNAYGSSNRTVPPRNDAKFSGGDKELHKKAGRLTPMKPGIGLPKGKGPVSFKKKNAAGQSYKTVAPRGTSYGGGERATAKAARVKHLDDWARGVRKSP